MAETFSRARAAGARGLLTLRADSGFHSKAVLTTCRRAGVRFSVTARMDVRMLREHLRLDEQGDEMMLGAREKGLLSARGEHRVLRVARTIADLGGSERVRARDLGAALALRTGTGLTESRAA